MREFFYMPKYLSFDPTFTITNYHFRILLLFAKHMNLDELLPIQHTVLYFFLLINVKFPRRPITKQNYNLPQPFVLMTLI